MRKTKKNIGIYRSGFELTITDMLRKEGVPHEYETVKLNYTIPESKHVYTPDVILSNGVICELKGYFDAQTRRKMELVIKQNSHLDIRFVFMSPNTKLSKKSKTSYSMWCDKKGFKHGKPSDICNWAKEPSKK